MCLTRVTDVITIPKRQKRVGYKVVTRGDRIGDTEGNFSPPFYGVRLQIGTEYVGPHEGFLSTANGRGYRAGYHIFATTQSATRYAYHLMEVCRLQHLAILEVTFYGRVTRGYQGYQGLWVYTNDTNTPRQRYHPRWRGGTCYVSKNMTIVGKLCDVPPRYP